MYDIHIYTQYPYFGENVVSNLMPTEHKLKSFLNVEINYKVINTINQDDWKI